MRSKKLTWLVATVFLLFAAPFISVYAQDNVPSPIVLEYDAHRQAYIDALHQERLRFESEQERASSTQDKLADRVEALKDERHRIQAEIENRSGLQSILQNIRNGVLFVVSPTMAVSIGALSVFGSYGASNEVINKVVPIAFGVWAIMLFIFFRPSTQNKKNSKKKWLNMVLVLALLLMAPALFAQEALSKEQKLKISLDLTSQLFSMSDHERYLGILSMEELNNILVPELDSGNEFLKVYRKVDSGTGKAYFTIAALATKLGRNGEAIDAIKQLNRTNLKIDTIEHDYIITQALKFLIDQNQPKAASDLLDARLRTLTDSSKLISLSEFLAAKGFQTSAEKTIQQAIENAKSTNDLVRLGDFLYSINKQTEGKTAFEKALTQADRPSEFILISDAWSRNGIIVPISMLEHLEIAYAKRRDEDKSLLDFQIELISAVYQNQKNENAIQLFSHVLGKLKSADVDAYRQLIDYALANEWYEQATSTVRDLVRKLPSDKRFEVRIRPNQILSSEDGLPDRSGLSLPVLYGLLNEEQQLQDKAISSYINSIQHSLNKIQASMGYEVNYNLNDFYLLGRQYKAGDNLEMLSALDAAYTLLEEQSIADLKLENEDILASNIDKLESQKTEISDLEQDINNLKQLYQTKIWQTRLQTISLAGSIVFLLALLGVCIAWAKDYSLSQSAHRFSAFIFKFIELFGWAKVCSIFGAISGFMMVLAGQLVLIFQRTHEEVKSIRKESIPLEKSIPNEDLITEEVTP